MNSQNGIKINRHIKDSPNMSSMFKESKMSGKLILMSIK